VRIDRLKLFLDSMGGGAWPFLVGGVICLVNSVNERDLDLLNRPSNFSVGHREVWGKVEEDLSFSASFSYLLFPIRG
jgi:hypothetical protein